MNHGAIKKSSLLKVLKKVIAKTKTRHGAVNEGTLDVVITEINRHISEYDQRLMQTSYAPEDNDNVYIIFAWTNEAEINQFQHTYNEGEVKFFHLLIKEIMEDAEHTVESIDALNCTSQIEVKPITKSRAEALLDEWIDTGYFRVVNDDILFGPRMIVEFMNYLRQHYPAAIKVCNLCQGYTLSNPPWCVNCSHCKVELHGDCIKKYLKRIKACPKCKQPWPNSEQTQAQA